MAVDVFTKRPRTPNTKYSNLTEIQEDNIRKKSRPFFQYTGPVDVGDKRFPMQEHARLTSEHSVRGVGRTQPYCWMGDRNRLVHPAHSTSQPGAFFKWGPERIGTDTAQGGARDSGLQDRQFERNQTALPDVEMQMKFGRANTGYYAQRHPQSETWFGSSHVLNQRVILQDAFPKTTRQYELINEARNSALNERKLAKWPQYSEYTLRYQLHEQTPNASRSNSSNKLVRDQLIEDEAQGRLQCTILPSGDKSTR